MNKKTILQKCWIWNKKVIDFMNKYIKGYSLNICAGENPLCTINLDLDPKNKSILKGDMRNLPFSSNHFDTVLSDPPWKIGYYQRFKPFFEAVRVCKVGGIIIYNATWIPTATNVELLEIFVRQDTEFSNTSIITIFKKTKSEEEIKKDKRKIKC